MSKSLGETIDPLDLIDRFGADALRFSLARLATGNQQDIPLSEEAVEGGQHFANKIWNAGRLVLRVHPGGVPELPPLERWTLAERWIVSRSVGCVEEVDAAIEDFRFSDAAQTLQRFVWSEYCDWALELEKGRLSGGEQERADAAAVLAWVLERALRLLHPIMPFVTEEIWQRFGLGGSIVVAHWPEAGEGTRDPEAERDFAFLQEVVTEIRRLQTGAASGMGKAVELDRSLQERAEPYRGEIEGLTRATISFGDLEGARARLVVAEGVDAAPLIEAKTKKLREAQEQLGRRRTKLANEGFVSKAPAEVVEKERTAVANLEDEERRLQAELRQLAAPATE
jgi:valyl-tRNA synthetase